MVIIEKSDFNKNYQTMVNFYKSDFPNQVHQLNVSISKHYCLLNNNTIKWQEKKNDLNWNNFVKSKKRSLVTFIIRDHFSSCYYAELHSIDKMPTIGEFLYRAWNKKPDYEFWGIGHNIVIPQATLVQFPDLMNFFKRVKIKMQLPRSGFDSAIRSIRDWEQQIKFIIVLFSETVDLSVFQQRINLINKYINNDHNSEYSNLKTWVNNSPKIIVPNEREQFIGLFNS